MTEGNVPLPTNAKDFLTLLHSKVVSIIDHLDRLDPNTENNSQKTDPVFELLESILAAIGDLQTSSEVLHQRVDAIARYVPAAARAVSGKP